MAYRVLASDGVACYGKIGDASTVLGARPCTYRRPGFSQIEMETSCHMCVRCSDAEARDGAAV
eukprot:SAG11_NODE_126_length_15729_cov_9.966859_10_plen_63_part_00